MDSNHRPPNTRHPANADALATELPTQERRKPASQTTKISLQALNKEPQRAARPEAEGFRIADARRVRLVRTEAPSWG